MLSDKIKEYRKRPEVRAQRKAYRQKPESKERDKIYGKRPEVKNKRIHQRHLRRQKQKYTVMSHYSKGAPVCECCKENHIEFLTIDHINGGGNKHRKEIGMSGHNFYRFLIRENFPDGYRVLCYNCNCSLVI